jgi:Fe-S cluster biogenesis protein NfuA
MVEEQGVHKQAEEIERLVREVEAITDAQLREKVVALVQSLLEFHRSGIQRLMQIISSEGDGAASLLEKIAGDQLVASLLTLYGSHPLSIESRVGQAIDGLNSHPMLHSCTVELLGISDLVVRLRLVQDKNCHSSPQILRTAIQEALYEAAPDVEEIQFVEDAAPTSVSFVPLDSVRGKNGLTRTLKGTLPKS